MNRSVIDQAIGIIISRTGSTTDEAFERIRRRSQNEHIKVPVVAAHIVEVVARRARARGRVPRPVVTDRSNRLNARKGDEVITQAGGTVTLTFAEPDLRTAGAPLHLPLNEVTAANRAHRDPSSVNGRDRSCACAE